jgi:hypothetical protein
VLEIEAQDAEERRPAALEPLELVVPVVRLGEEAVHHADDAGAARPGLDGLVDSFLA